MSEAMAATAPVAGAGFKDAVQSGVADARASVEQVIPKIAAAINKGIYSLAYGMSFGVAFPVVLMAKSLPQNNSIAWGFIDGAQAAKKAANRTLGSKSQ
ncbi:MAG: hypothetical protein JWN70_1332 [Planctomycetaceae bacterium]|nr:hypothetical protein [Planctomycetaceae bacterium]